MEPKKPISHVVAGLLIAGIVIAISMVMMLMAKSAGKPGSGGFTYLIIIGGLIFFINQYGKANDYQPTFGELFSYGFKATTVYTILFIGFLLLFAVLFPDFKSTQLEVARTAMENQKGITEEQADKGMEMMEKYFWVFAIGGTTVAFVIIGAIGSLIGAAITKKRPKNPFEQLPQ
jgi:hypothetical protein